MATILTPDGNADTSKDDNDDDVDNEVQLHSCNQVDSVLYLTVQLCAYYRRCWARKLSGWPSCRR